MVAISYQIYYSDLNARRDILTSNPNRQLRDERHIEVPTGQGGATRGGMPWEAAASPNLRLGHYKAWWLGFPSSKWSREQGDPYPRILDDGSDS
jgi:hypothetical protein